MFLIAASAVYGSVAAWRRKWYARDRSRRRRLARPVISVGNLCVGGSGKTPIVANIAQMLRANGERPAILSRGYGRRRTSDGVTVVSDGTTILAGLDTAGDEPLMLARAIGGVPVLVGADRYLAGCLAERQFGATVHLLDDGFQHLGLARDIDLLIAAEEDLSEHVLPAGRLREPLASAAAADALLTPAEDGVADRLRRTLGLDTAFRIERRIGPAWSLRADDRKSMATDARVFAVAGIARPERFFNDLSLAGWLVAGTMRFRDHHAFTRSDVERIARAARAADADLVLTTEKDAVRLEAGGIDDLPAAAVPLTASIEPEAEFAGWLLGRLRAQPTQPGPEL